MKHKLQTFAGRMVAAAGPTLKRFWASVGFTVALTVTLIVNTSVLYPQPEEDLARLSMALVAGILASWCGVLLWESWSFRDAAPRPDSTLVGNLLALGLGCGISWAGFAMLNGLTFVAVSRHVGICIFLFLMFFVIPNWKKGRSLEMYVVRLFTQAVIAVLFAAVLFIGLTAITATVDYLFSLDLSHRIYLHTWFVMAGVVAPFLFMAGIPEPGSSVPESDYPKTLSNLVMYVITPVLAAYTFILYLYFTKILLTRKWPVGLVSHLVLWYAAFTTAILLFTRPLAHSNRWSNAFSRYFPIGVIPLLGMMFASLGIRIKHYGITENRYYVLVLGLWLLGIMFYLNLSKAKRSIVIPVTLAVVALMSVIGPWSSFAVSKWSQNRRLEGICARYGMLIDGAIQPSPQLSQEDRQEITAIIRYFDNYHDLSDVTLLPAGFTLADFEEVFGFPYMSADIPSPVHWFFYEAQNWSVNISEFDYLFDFTRTYYEDALLLLEDGITVAYDDEDKRISVTLNGIPEWEGSITDLMASIQDKYVVSDGQRLEPNENLKPGDRAADGTFKPEDMVFEVQSPNLRMKLVIDNIRCEFYPDSREPEIYYVGFLLLVKRLV